VHNQLALNLSEDRISVPISTRAEELPVPLPVIALVGPTASGKSALAIQLALTLAQHDHPAEIVNGDSMVVYRGMDIGTAKPSNDDRATVPHHLVDILDVTQSSSVALMQSRARQTFVDLRGRGVVPILVGGSALYSRAILDEMTIPPTDPAVRARLESELVEAGPHALHDRLGRLDPQAAKAILPGNGRRLVRALEVVELTGSFTATMPTGRYDAQVAPVIQIGLTLPREDMDRRIALRVEQMWRDGFVDEVRALPDLPRGRTASRALGYRQILQFLAGEINEDEAFEQTIVRTRRFARKQLMWYRKDDRIFWVDALSPHAVGDVLARLEETMTSW